MESLFVMISLLATIGKLFQEWNRESLSALTAADTLMKLFSTCQSSARLSRQIYLDVSWDLCCTALITVLIFAGPQIVFSLYGTNFWGTEVNLGYARLHVPCSISNERKSQPCIIRAPVFTPKSTNMWSSLMNLFTNKSPELRDPKILADGTKTKNLFTSSYGEIIVSLESITKGTDKLNFDS